MLNDKVKKSLVACFTFVITLGILLGGYYFYQERLIKAPVNNTIENLSYVSQVSFANIEKAPQFTIRFAPQYSLEKSFTSFINTISPKFKNSPVVIKINNGQNSLTPLVNQTEFAIYQGIKTGGYSDMLNACQTIADGYNANMKLEMDENYIYWQVSRNDEYLQAIYVKNPQEIKIKIINSIGDDV